MGKRKAAANPLPAPSARASVLPSPKLVGKGSPSEPPRVSAEEKPSAPVKHEPTLIGLPKHLPTALPPLRASTPPPEKRKAESSLVGLSLKVERTPRHKTGTRLKAPAGPPRSRDAGGHDGASAKKRHAADPTDYDVQIVDAYSTPPLPLAHHSETIDLANSDEVWEESETPEFTPDFRRNKRSTILTAVAVFAIAALGLGVCAYASNGKDREASIHAARIERRAETPAPVPKAVVPVASAPVADPTVPPLDAKSIAAPTEAPALEAPPASSLTTGEHSITKSPISKSKSKLSARQKQRRLRALHRAQKRKAKRAGHSASLDSSVSLR